MIEYFLTVCGQIFSMALMVVVGYIMFKVKMINEDGTKQMSAFLLKVVTPFILIAAYQREFDKDLFGQWIIMFAAVLLTYFIHIIAAELIYSGMHTITDACFLSGFENTSYFSREFKKKYGVSPLDYKNSATANDEHNTKAEI